MSDKTTEEWIEEFGRPIYPAEQAGEPDDVDHIYPPREINENLRHLTPPIPSIYRRMG